MCDVDIVTVQKLLGHASVQTTASYDWRAEPATTQTVGTWQVPDRRRTSSLSGLLLATGTMRCHPQVLGPEQPAPFLRHDLPSPAGDTARGGAP